MQRRVLPALLLFAAFAAAPLAAAQKSDFVPKADTYICPNSTGTGAVDCFLNAVEHCVDKHKLSMTRPYQAALREATGSRGAVDHLRALHEQWLQSLQSLKWKPGESDAEYKARIGQPYDAFKERALAVHEALKSSLAVKSATAATPSSRPPRNAAKAAPNAATKTDARDSAKGAAN
jgi:hypothetical protein